MKIIEECQKIEAILKNGFVEGYHFYASHSFKCEIDNYKGIRIAYINLIEKGLVYYAPKITM